MSYNSKTLEDLSSDTLRDIVVKCRAIIHDRRVEMAGAEDLAKRSDVQAKLRKNILINKYDELTDMIIKVGKSNAYEYIHERRKVADELWNEFSIVTEETKYLANPTESSAKEEMDYMKEADMVNHPPHYTTGEIEVIDFIDDKHLGFYEGQVIKYVSRAKLKNSGMNELEDLKKAQWYLNRLINNLSPKPE